MWNMSCREKVLTGPMALLWCHAAAYYACYVHDTIAGQYSSPEDLEEFLPEPLSICEAPQLLQLLLTTSQALLDPDVPEPELTAYNEQLIWHVLQQMICHIDAGGEVVRDKDVLQALRELDDEEVCQANEEAADDEELLEPRNLDDNDELTEFLEILSDHILWDRDFAMEELFADLPPEDKTAFSNQMNIDQDYYTTLPPLTDRSKREIYAELIELLSKHCPIIATKGFELPTTPRKKVPDRSLIQGETMDVPLSSIESGPLRHDNLTFDQMCRLQAVYEVVGPHDLSATNFREFAAGFLRDQNPEREVLVWEKIADAVKRYLRDNPQADGESVFNTALLLTCSNSASGKLAEELGRYMTDPAYRRGS